MDKSELTDDLRAPAEIREACGLAVVNSHAFRCTDLNGEQAIELVNAVLDTIIAHSQSPRAVDELTRIRGSISD